jgi:hypothetical protein
MEKTAQFYAECLQLASDFYSSTCPPMVASCRLPTTQTVRYQAQRRRSRFPIAGIHHLNSAAHFSAFSGMMLRISCKG